MENYAIYLRKSRADIELEKQGQFETLKLHEERLLKLAEQRQYFISEIYRELVSGDSISNRPEMQRLLDAVRERKYTGVLVTEVSRLARGDSRDQGIVTEAFRDSQTLIITPDKIYDPTSELDEDFFDFSLFMARQEYKYIKRRMQAATKQLREQGCWLSTFPPYGYDKIPHSLIPNDHAEVVRRIFRECIAGETTSQIANHLLHDGIPTAKGGIWDAPTIRNLLRNEAYCGILVLNKVRTKKITENGKARKYTVWNSPDQWRRIQGNWQPIISEDDFQKAQSKFGTHPKIKHTGAHPKNPLSGLLRCEKCGYVMKMHMDSRTLSIPRFYHRVPSDCFQSGIALEALLPPLKEALMNALDDFTVTIKSEQELIDLSPMRKKLDDLRNREKKVYDAFEGGIYTMQQFLIRRDEIESQIKNQLQAIALAEQQNASYTDPEYLSMSVHQAIKDIGEKDPLIINEFLRGFIEKITYSREPRKDPILKVYFKSQS